MFYKKIAFSLSMILLILGLATSVQAESLDYQQTITLESGWNIISTPRVVDSHDFSAEEISENFDIFLMNRDNLSGWSTMQELGQSEFVPLYGYFINNKTGLEQTLVLNYVVNPEPSDRIFERSLHQGWNVLGIANPSYSVYQESLDSFDSDNIHNILTSLSGCVDIVLDFTADADSMSSVRVGDQWDARVFADADLLNDFRETKAYAVYLSSDCSYQGFQNNSPLISSTTLVFNADDNDGTAQVGEPGVSAVSFTITENGDEYVYLTGLTFKNEGNLDTDDTGIFTLLYNNGEVATGEMLGDYVSFVFDEILIEESNIENFEVVVDFVGGSAGETLILIIDEAVAYDSSGYPVSVDNTAFDVDDSDSTVITLENGNLVVNFNSSTALAKDVLAGTDSVILGRLEITANAEAVTINGLTFTVTGTAVDADDLDEFIMVGVDGTTGSYDLDNAFAVDTYTLTTDEDVYIAKGETASFNIKADVLSGADIGDKYRVNLASNGIDAEGEESEEVITNIVPSSIYSQYATVVASGLTHTILSLNDVTAIAGNTSSVKVYKGRLTAALVSDVKVTKMVITSDNIDRDADGIAKSDFNDDDISEVTLIINSYNIETEIDIINRAVTFNEDFIVPAGDSVDFYVELSVAYNVEIDDAFKLGVTTITAKNSGDNTDTVIVTPATVYGSAPLVTLASTGIIDITLDVTESEANSDTFVVAGETSDLMATLNFDAQDEAVVIENLELRATANDADLFDNIDEVQLVDSDQITILATSDDFVVTGGAVVYNFDGWDYEIAKAGVKEIYIRVVTNEIGVGAEQVGTSNTLINFMIVGVEARGASGDVISVVGANTPDSTDSVSEYDNDAVTKNVTNAGVVVTSITDDIADSDLNDGTNYIGRFQFVIDSGNNTDASGNAVGFNLDNTRITIGTDVDDIGTVEVYWESDSATKVLFSNAISTGLVDLSGLKGISDTDVLVVKASGLSTGGDNKYIETSIANLATDIVWNDGTDGDNITGVLLNYNDVSGTSLTN